MDPHHRPYPSDIQLPRGQLVRIIPKAQKNYSLAIRDAGEVVVVLADGEDKSQLWIKDESYGNRVKDNFGSPAFALVNKAHGKVLKHPREKGQQVHLADFRLGMIGDEILWTESQDFGEGFTTIRMASDTLLNMSVVESDKKGKIENGAPIFLDTWHKNKDSQLWKIFPLSAYLLYIIHRVPSHRPSTSHKLWDVEGIETSHTPARTYKSVRFFLNLAVWGSKKERPHHPTPTSSNAAAAGEGPKLAYSAERGP